VGLPRSGCMRAIWISVVYLLLGTGLAAAEKAKPNHSVVLRKLCELAEIPDLTGAESGRLADVEWSPAMRRRLKWRGAQPYEYSRASGWKLGKNADGSLRVLLEGLPVVSIYALADKDESRSHGRWLPVSIRRLVAHSSDGLRRMARARNKRHWGAGARWADRRGGQLLLDATFLFAAGKHKEANNLAETLFAAGSARGMMLGAHFLAAEGAYKLAFMHLLESGDEEAFVKALQRLRRRAPKNWPRLPGLAHVLGVMQAAHAVPDSAAAAVLGEEDRGLLQDLIKKRPCRSLCGASRWLFFAPQDLPPEERSSALIRLLRRGVDALPVILALAEEPQPIWYVNDSRNPYRSAGDIDFGGDDDDDDGREGDVNVFTGAMGGRSKVTGMFAYRGLPHLLTGAELAKILLRGIWQGKYGGRREDVPGLEELVRDARQWHATRKGLSRPALAKMMLAEQGGRAQAVSYLLAHTPAERDFPALEAAILKLDHSQMVASLSRLVKLRGGKAGPTIEEAIKQARADGEGGIDNLERPLREARKKRMPVTAFRKALREAFAGKGTWELYPLQARAREFKGDKALAGELLEYAADSEDAAQRQILLGMMEVVAGMRRGRNWGEPSTPYTWEDFEREAEQKPGPAGAEREKRLVVLDLRRYAPAWRKLMPEPPPRSALQEGYSATSDVCWPFFEMYAPQDQLPAFPWELLGLAPPDMLPGGMESHVRQRVLAMLDAPGKPIPPWPSAGSVPPQQRRKTMAALAELPAKEARKQVYALPIDEFLAFMEDLPEHEVLAHKLLVEPRWTVPPCKFIGPVPQPVRDVFTRLGGRRLSKEWAEEALSASRALVAKGHSFVAVFMGGPWLTAHFEVAAVGTDAEASVVRDHLAYYLYGRGRNNPHSRVDMRLSAEDYLCASWPARKADGGDRPAAALAGNGAPDRRETTRREALLKALDGTPAEHLLEPRNKVRLKIVGLTEDTWMRLAYGIWE